MSENHLRPLILGTALGYKPEQISVFVNSLKKSKFNGTTALLVDRTNRRLQDYLIQNRIEAVLVDPVPEWKQRTFKIMVRCLRKSMVLAKRFNPARKNQLHPMPLKRSEALFPKWIYSLGMAHLVIPVHHIINTRYVHYLNYLRRNSGQFSHVLLTDVRDVAFQSDPFEGAPARCLWFFLENPGKTLLSNRYNRSWIEAAYGAHELEQIGKNPIICSGTTFGSSDLICGYLEQMTVELIRLTPTIFGPALVDQGIHNYLYWTGSVPEAELKDNYQGPVITLALESPDSFRFDDAEQLLNIDGSPIAILHQYDRHPSLVEKMLERHQESSALAGG